MVVAERVGLAVSVPVVVLVGVIVGVMVDLTLRPKVAVAVAMPILDAPSD